MSLIKIVPWVVSPIVLQVLFRTRGGYYYRTAVSMFCVSLSAIYGALISLVLPLIGKRHLINWTVSRVHKTLFSNLLGINCKIEGKENIRTDGGQAIYVCNHQSILDIFFMANVFPKSTAVVAKKSIKFVPVLGWFMYFSKTIFLDRANRDSAVKNARDAASQMKKNKTSIWIFPEGTRQNTPDRDLLPFKKGAFYMAAQANVPVIPIVVQNYNHLYDKKCKRFGHGEIKIKVLPPISTEDVEESSESIDKLTNRVRSDMLQVLRDM